jgi:hypothetical protein
MKLHVLYDRSGKILAAVRLDDQPLGIVTPRPVCRPGQFTADVTVPDNFRHLSFFEVCTRLVVEGLGERATLKSRKSHIPSNLVVE